MTTEVASLAIGLSADVDTLRAHLALADATLTAFIAQADARARITFTPLIDPAALQSQVAGLIAAIPFSAAATVRIIPSIQMPPDVGALAAGGASAPGASTTAPGGGGGSGAVTLNVTALGTPYQVAEQIQRAVNDGSLR